MAKKRLDIILLEKQIFDSRQKAQAAIMAGLVKVGDKIIDKPGTLVKEEEAICLLKDITEGYVSRGGFKMEKAIKEFNPEIKGKIFLDVGASTGGFTDCLLKHGASYVYAIDVGYGQLDWSLRQDNRVKVIERCNARYLKPEVLYPENQERADGAVIDVSFISLDKIMPAVIDLLKPEFFIVSLIKPQFEAGKEKVKKGVVESPQVHREVLENFLALLKNLDLQLLGLTFSPIKGPSGNIEFLGLAGRGKEGITPDLEKIIKDAHSLP